MGLELQLENGVLVEPSNIIDAARFAVALKDCETLAASGWKLCHYESANGHSFVGFKSGIRIRSEQNMSCVLALQRCLNLLLKYDEESHLIISRIPHV